MRAMMHSRHIARVLSSPKNLEARSLVRALLQGSLPQSDTQDWDDTLFPTTWLESKKAATEL